MEVVTPATGLRTRNTSLTLRLNFSESLSAVHVVFAGDVFVPQPPDTFVRVNVSGEGNFTLELFAVDKAGNIQRHPTMFSWTTDISAFYSFPFPLPLLLFQMKFLFFFFF